MSKQGREPVPTWTVFALLAVGGYCWFQLISLYGGPKRGQWQIPENKPAWHQVAEVQINEEKYGKLPPATSLNPRSIHWFDELKAMPSREAKARIKRFHGNLTKLHAARRAVIEEMNAKGKEAKISDPLDLMTPREYGSFLQQTETEMLADLAADRALLVDAGSSPKDGGSQPSSAAKSDASMLGDTGSPSPDAGRDAATAAPKIP